jgi:archaellum biogenesis protein FlaJ (TadC family)
MSLSDKELLVLKQAIASRKMWRIMRIALIPVAVGAAAAALYLVSLPEFAHNRLATYLSGLLMLIAVGVTALLLSGWSDIKNETLIALLQNKQNR